jgi:SpoIID/LytB domain protein
MRQLTRAWSRICRAFEPVRSIGQTDLVLMPGAKVFRSLRELVELLPSSGFSRAAVLFAAALISVSGGSERTKLLADKAKANDVEIDSVLQQVAENALSGRDGTIIIMDAQSARVRAVVNQQEAFAQALMPGSAMKPFTALAALRANLVDENSRTVCPGRFTGRDFSVACVHADHLPPFTPSQAIAYSCNYYFATVGERVGSDKLLETLRQFGFGQTTGAVNDEVPGVLRPCESNSRIRVDRASRPETQSDCGAREAIGESDHIQVTPIQLLTAYAALVNGGHVFHPARESSNDFRPRERAFINISPRERSIITEGMAGAIRYGTARSAKLDSLPLTILGKTGTAMPARGFRTNGWFVGFAGAFQSNGEVDPSSIKLAVLVLLTRAHGSEAAAIAKPIFEAYADEISHRDAEAQRLANQNGPINDPTGSASPLLPIAASVRVHLVHDNVTQQLSVEDYVLGVMRAEAAMETEPEALKALAIAIRTYALKNAGRHAKDGYDFCSTTHCQRFVLTANRGRWPTAKRDLLLDAVRSTEGQVLLDEHGKVIDSYFGASCGGETANIGTLWGIAAPEYLRGVRDEYCAAGPHAEWIDTLSRAELLRALQSDSRTDVGNRLDQIIVSQRDETGRAEFITLEGERRKIVRGWDFKIVIGRALGWNVLKSSRFEVSRAGSNFVFRGRGFGHGLGLCQEGAHVMAARRMNYQRILEKYFPGTSILPRSGSFSLARPLKAGAEQKKGPVVASATIEFGLPQPSLTRRTEWNLDLIPALKGRAKVIRRYAAVPFASNRLLSISSEHFRVTYPTTTEFSAPLQVMTILEKARADYLRRAANASLAVPSLPFLEIRMNGSTGDFTAHTGQPWWAAAATKGNRIELQPVAILKRRGVLETTLRHELAHAVIDTVSRNRARRWLEEGFAMYLAGEGNSISRLVPKTKLTDDELERRLERPGSQSEMRALYALAYRRVSELIQTEGENKVWSRLANQ